MSDFKQIIAKRKRQDFIFNIIGILCTLIGILTLGALLVDLLMDGLASSEPGVSHSVPVAFCRASRNSLVVGRHASDHGRDGVYGSAAGCCGGSLS